MNPALVAVVREAIADWKREAEGSRTMAEYHDRAAVDALESGKRSAAQHEATADEHRSDAERANQAAHDLAAALVAEGVEP